MTVQRRVEEQSCRLCQVVTRHLTFCLGSLRVDSLGSGGDAGALRRRPREGPIGLRLQAFEPVQRASQPARAVFIKKRSARSEPVLGEVLRSSLERFGDRFHRSHARRVKAAHQAGQVGGRHATAGAARALGKRAQAETRWHEVGESLWEPPAGLARSK